LNDEHFPSIEKLMEDNKDMLKKEAKKRLQNGNAHPDVMAHWKMLAEKE
jgi:hypothetical protein